MSKDAAFDFIPNPQGMPLDEASFLASALARENGAIGFLPAPAIAFSILATIIIAFLALRAMKR